MNGLRPLNLSGAFLLATNPLEGAFLIRKGRERACACERCGEIFMHRELLDGHKYCSTCAAYIRNHTCSQCGNYFDFELNRHGSRILCDECLAMIEEAEENGTPVLRKVKAEDVPPAIRGKTRRIKKPRDLIDSAAFYRVIGQNVLVINPSHGWD